MFFVFTCIDFNQPHRVKVELVWTSLPLAALLGSTLASPSPSALAEPLRFRLLPQESQILTQISDPFGQTVNGEFTLREGEAEGGITNLQGTGRVRLTIDAASYNSGDSFRDEDVQEDYLEVEQYPTITFTSTGVEDIKEPASPEGSWEFTVKGVLDLHGIKREIRVPVKMTRRERKILAEGKTDILLNDFNITVPTLLFFFSSGDEVGVKFRFVGERQP